MFDELATNFANMTPEVEQEIYSRYGFEIDNDSVARLCAEHRLTYEAE
jgi:hypothetical protein